MTNEQAIKWLKDYIQNTPFQMEQYERAFDMAIQALSQEPCTDAVSREAVLDEIEKWIVIELQYTNATPRLIKRINELPSVTQKSGEWIVDGSVDCYLDKVRCHCSECGKKKEFPADYDHIKQELSISYKYPEFIDNFCSNCGAKMVESQERRE